MKKTTSVEITEGSGNIFADLGFSNPEREQLKARLTLQIYRLIKDRGLTQAKAGEILRIKQPHVSSLMRGQSGNFSVERLMDFLTALGQDVDITVQPAPVDREARVRLFDQAIERQRKRDLARKPKPTRDRGWKREDLYTRGRSR
jgi:predicted XRE-type DNA-binding protein